MPPIQILLDSNEKGSERARALALACGGDPAYELQGFAEIPVDMRLAIRDEDPIIGSDLCNISEQAVNVELKEIPDFWSSKASGHLGQQILGMLQAHEPGFIAVFGSLHEVLEQVPKVASGGGKPMRRGQMAIAQDINTARAFCGTAAACGVPVHFLSSSHEQSFRWILSYAKNMLTGPSLASWLPRFSVDPVGYGILCSIPGIGDQVAKGLLQEYGGIAQIVDDCRFNPEELADTKINGKRLGPAKASKIIKAMGCA